MKNKDSAWACCKVWIDCGARRYSRATTASGLCIKCHTGGAVSWHRAFNAKGEIRTRTQLGCEKVQRVLLEREAIEFDLQGCVELARFCWKPRVLRNLKNKNSWSVCS